jgi:putative membrane protein
MQMINASWRAGFAAILLTLTFGCERSSQNVRAAKEDASTSLSEADRKFITEAEEDNIKDRTLARVVIEKSTNSDVKDYAQMLVDDHTKALRNLVDLMENAGMKQPSGLTEAKNEADTRLRGLSGAALDREYINLMVQDHEKAVAKFQKEETSAKSQSVRDYAKQVLPVLEKHLKKARELQSQLQRSSNS